MIFSSVASRAEILVRCNTPGTSTFRTLPYTQGFINTPNVPLATLICEGPAWTPQPLSAGDRARVTLRAENVRLGERGPANVFSGMVLERRYQGMQTVYDVELGGQRLEALELGTAARYEQNGEIALTLPPDMCWAYRDDSAALE